MWLQPRWWFLQVINDVNVKDPRKSNPNNKLISYDNIFAVFMIKIPLDKFLWSTSWRWSNAIASSAKVRSGSKRCLWSGKLRWVWCNQRLHFICNVFMSICNSILIFSLQYRELYFEGGVSSVYLWDLDAGLAGVILIKKAGDGSKKIKGKPWFTEPAMKRSKQCI